MNFLPLDPSGPGRRSFLSSPDLPSLLQAAAPTVTSPRLSPARLAHGSCWRVTALRALPYLAVCLIALSSEGQEAPPLIDLSTEAKRTDTVRRLKAKAVERRAAALAWADKAKRPARILSADGRHVAELVGLDADGRPLYLTTENANAGISTGVSSIRNMAPYQLNGGGWTVGVWDSGAVLNTHQEFGARVGIADGTAAKSDHATHVAGTIGAAGLDALALGMAPQANIASYDWNSDTAEMTAAAAITSGQAGRIALSNHSYGFITGWFGSEWFGTWGEAEARGFGLYSSGAREWDSLAASAPYYLAFVAAGNDRNDQAPQPGAAFTYFNGGYQSGIYDPAIHPAGDGVANNGYDTISYNGTAKNIVTVGAVNDAVSGGNRAPGAGTMSSFSCWGPTDDGRIKPDLVANGVGLYSPVSGGTAGYDRYSGTSMASPNASGSAILLQELHADLNAGLWMRAATLKALLLHTADDLGNPGPDYQFGWGLINARAAADLIAADAAAPLDHYLTEDTLTSASPGDSFTVASNGSTALRITLSWTDPAGTERNSLDDPAPVLVNDLDIRVNGPGGTRLPYILNPAVPSAAASNGDNIRDNSEQIFIPAPVPGDYVVTVSHKGVLTGGNQAYSLVITGQGAGGGIVSAVVTDTQVDEDGDNAVAGITLSQPATSPVTVTYSTVPDSALPGQDYLTTTGSLVVPAGQTTGAVIIPILDDSLPEPSESFELRINSVSGALLADASAVVTIRDDDQTRLVRVAVFDNPSYVDTAGSVESESDQLQASLTALGFPVTTFSGTALGDWSTAFENADVVVIPELENGNLAPALDESTRRMIEARVHAGKGLLMFPDHLSFTRLTALANALFGWNLTAGVSSAGGLPVLRESPAPPGFEDLPQMLQALNGTHAVQRASLPAGSRVLYSFSSDPAQVAGFRKGTAGFLAWDWYNASQPGSDLWRQALGRLVEVMAGGGSIIPAELAATEHFTGFGDACDLAGKSVTFTPDGSGGYTYRTVPITELPVDPAEGTDLSGISNTDDAFQQITFTSGFSFPFYGTTETSIFVSSNGLLSFGTGYPTYSETLATHLSRRQIAMLWDDLLPFASGSIRAREDYDHWVVTFDQVAEFSDATPNTFQAELFRDGRIRLSWLQITLEDAVVGISPGGLQDLADIHEEEDFSSGISGAPVLGVEPAFLSVGADATHLEFLVNSNTLWTWTCDSAWLLTGESPAQGGDTLFRYVLPANPGPLPRTATVTLVAGGETATYQVTQAAGSGQFTTSLIQDLDPPSQSVWRSYSGPSLGDAYLVTPAAILYDAFDSVGNVTLSSRPDPGTLIANNVWKNTSIAPQTDTFSASFTTVPGGSSVDTVIGFSRGAADFWSDLAAYVRFNPGGEIDARKAGVFDAENTLEYSAGVPYLVEMTVNVATKRYWATVTPNGGSPVVIADNYAFRTDQNTVSQLDNLACLTWTGGTQSVSAIVTPSTPVVPAILTTPDTDGPLTASASSAGLAISKEIALVPGRHATDESITITNTGATPRSVSFQLRDNYGSDTETTVHLTSSGDSIVGPGDTWFVSSDQISPTMQGNDPALMVSWRFTDTVPSPVWIEVPGNGDDELRSSFQWTLPPGLSATFVMRRELFNTAAQAIAEGVPLGDLVLTTADSGPGSLRQVVADAASGSVVRFDPALAGQTIQLTGGQIIIDKDLRLDASDLSADVIVSAGGLSRIFEIYAGAEVEMNHLTITGGSEGDGGGIWNGGWLRMTGCTVTDSYAYWDGGGIYNGGRLDLENCEISGNGADYGGGVFNVEASEGTWYETRILSNNAFGGGGVFNSSFVVLDLSRCRVAGNDARWGAGGGFYHAGDAMDIEDSDISGNLAGTGGAILNFGALELSRSTLAWNHAGGGSGGAISNGGDGGIMLDRCTVANNRAVGAGGGIRNLEDGLLDVIATTISTNHSDASGGGIANVGTLALQRSIIAANSAAGSAPDISGTIGSQTGQNLMGVTAGSSGFTGLVAAPLLSPLGIHGGPTATMPPLPGSPAVDQGGASATGTDQRGFTRLLGAGVDLGAVETGNPVPTVVVNTAADEDDGTGVNGVSLRDAVRAAVPGSTISFAPALAGQVLQITAGPIAVDRNLALISPSPGVTLDGGGSSRLLEIGPAVHATLENLNLIDGFSGDTGGAVRNAGLLVARGCLIGGNEAVEDGGGIDSSILLVLEDCTVASNTSYGKGGGIACQGLLEIHSSLLSQNSASGGGGGGVHGASRALIASSTFALNTCNGGGGGISSTGRVELRDSTVSGNTGTGAGGVFASDELLVLGNSIVAKNLADADEPMDIISDNWIGIGVNLVSDTTGISGFGGLVGDPGLAPLGDYGGPTLSMPPLPGSPAIDAATVLFSTHDQRGLPRPAGAAADIGAVETQPQATLVSHTGDSGPGSLRDAVANALPGATITFEDDLDGDKITLTSGQLSIVRDLVIDAGSLPSGIIISGNGQSRVMKIGPFVDVGLTSLTITGGQVDNELDGEGAGIFNEGNLHLDSCIIHANEASYDGGGIYNAGDLSMVDCTVSDNLSYGYGGGIHTTGDLVIHRCTLSGNGAGGGNGGGIAQGDESYIEIHLSTMADNSCNGNGGAIYMTSQLDLIDCTLSENAGIGVGGIENEGGFLGLFGSIVANNFDQDGELTDIGGVVGVDDEFCLVSSTYTISGYSGLVGAPMLAPLGLYGGPTLTMPPLPGSIAIDGGSTDGGTDQRGLPRYVGAGQDIGAVEAGSAIPIVTVNTLADEDDGNLGASISLREASRYAAPGSVVAFAPALDGQQIVLGGEEIVLGRNLSIDATSLAGGISVSGNAESRVFRTLPARSAMLKSLTVTGGYSDDGGGILNEGILGLNACTISDCFAYSGGAIHSSGGLRLELCAITDNFSDGSGGGITITSGKVTIASSTLSGNGCWNSGAGLFISSFGRVEMTGSTLADNDSLDGHGGGISNYGTLDLTTSTLAGNYSRCMGGGLDNFGYASLRFCTIAGNQADDGSIYYYHPEGGGGGINNNHGGSLHLDHSIVAGNSDANDYARDLRGPVDGQTGANLIGNIQGTVGFTGLVADPLLGPLTDNGGPTPTLLPMAGSPAIDAGTSTTLATDQRGLPRVFGASVDLGAVEVQPDTLVVVNDDDSGTGSLRDVVQSAPAGATVTFDPALDFDTIVLTSGPVVIDKNLEIDATARVRLSVSADWQSNVFEIPAGRSVRVAGLTIRDGIAGAGGLVTNSGNLVLEHCILSGGDALEGGLLFNESGGTAELSDCRLTDGLGTYGAAAYNGGSMILERVVIERNQAEEEGGALFSTGTLIASDSIVRRNGSDFFAGGIASQGSMGMTRCTIEDNSSGDSGGGLSVSNGTLDSCTISGNTCFGDGGGILHSSGTLSVTNCTVSGNTAEADSGGGVHSSGVLHLVSTTISGNHAVIQGGGIYGVPSAQLHLRNAIIAGNSAQIGGPDLFGGIQTQTGGNLLASTSGVTSPFSGIVADPLLLPLGIYGGPTLTMPPSPGSPAINAGSANSLDSDQRGLARTVGPAVDLGSVESGNALPTVIVNTLVDESDGLAVGGISLREAVAEAAPGASIGFAPALDGGVISLASNQLLVASTRIIDATALSSGITLTTSGDHRAIEVAPGTHAAFRGITVSGITTDDDGAAILNRGILELTGCRLIGNNGADGGGIRNSEELVATDCLIHDHEAWGDGGGVFNDGTATFLRVNLTSNGTSNSGAGFYNTGFLDLTDCYISGGYANIEGGGVYNTLTGDVRMLRCTVSENVSEGSAGGGALNLGSLRVSSSTIAENRANYSVGAGIANLGSSATLVVEESTISGNENDDFEEGGGIFNGSTSFFSLRNSIIAGNLGNDVSPDISGTITVAGGVNLVGSTGGIAGAFNGIVADPRLAPLGDYGGLTPVMPPLPGSPVIEAAAGGPATDQLGRPRPSGPLPDIGAVEALPFSSLALDDIDTDGIPDILEPPYGLVVGVGDAAADSDGDGSTDAGEIANMTDPLDSADYLRVGSSRVDLQACKLEYSIVSPK